MSDKQDVAVLVTGNVVTFTFKPINIVGAGSSSMQSSAGFSAVSNAFKEWLQKQGPGIVVQQIHFWPWINQVSVILEPNSTPSNSTCLNH